MTADPSPPVVVAAAVRDAAGRVLAAQRTYPPEMAGRWELPGGKVEPGERDEDALVREIGEELGVAIVLRDRIGGDWPIVVPWVLRLWVADLAGPGEEPQAREHAALRWLAPDALLDLDWIPGDRPMVAALQERLTR